MILLKFLLRSLVFALNIPAYSRHWLSTGEGKILAEKTLFGVICRFVKQSTWPRVMNSSLKKSEISNFDLSGDLDDNLESQDERAVCKIHTLGDGGETTGKSRTEDVGSTGNPADKTGRSVETNGQGLQTIDVNIVLDSSTRDLRFRGANHAAEHESGPMYGEHLQGSFETDAFVRFHEESDDEAGNVILEVCRETQEGSKDVPGAEAEGGDNNEENHPENTSSAGEVGEHEEDNLASGGADGNPDTEKDQGEEADVDVKEEDVDVKGEDVDVGGEDVDHAGEDVDVEEEDDVEGEDVDVEGEDVDVEGEDVNVKGEDVDLEGEDDWEDLIDEDFKNYYASPIPEPKQYHNAASTMSKSQMYCSEVSKWQGRKIFQLARKQLPASWQQMPKNVVYLWYPVSHTSKEYFCVSDAFHKCNLVTLNIRRLQHQAMFGSYVFKRQYMMMYHCDVNIECIRYVCIHVRDVEKLAVHNLDRRYLSLTKRDGYLYSTPCKAILACNFEKPVMVVCRCVKPGLRLSLISEVYPEYVVNFQRMIKVEGEVPIHSHH